MHGKICPGFRQFPSGILNLLKLDNHVPSHVSQVRVFFVGGGGGGKGNFWEKSIE